MLEFSVFPKFRFTVILNYMYSNMVKSTLYSKISFVSDTAPIGCWTLKWHIYSWGKKRMVFLDNFEPPLKCNRTELVVKHWWVLRFCHNFFSMQIANPLFRAAKRILYLIFSADENVKAVHLQCHKLGSFSSHLLFCVAFILLISEYQHLDNNKCQRNHFRKKQTKSTKQDLSS